MYVPFRTALYELSLMLSLVTAQYHIMHLIPLFLQRGRHMPPPPRTHLDITTEVPKMSTRPLHQCLTTGA